LETDYKQHLRNEFGIEFHRLLTITNMPISRFANALHQSGKFAEYMGLLINHFNLHTLENLMCRSLVSVGWDGKLYDCDFNQLLSISLETQNSSTIWEIDSFSGWSGRKIATGNHCYGCTSGSGSSCQSTLQ
jgi:radical SAM/Cys-rich protein